MRSRIATLWSIAAILAGLGLTAPMARAANIPSFLPSGTTTRPLFFAWFNQNGVYYDFEGTTNAQFAADNGTYFEPKLAQATPAGDMWVFSILNGPAGQQDLVQSVPGSADGAYSPVMRLILLQWVTATPPLVTSVSQVYAFNQAGLLQAFDTRAWLNAPTVWMDTDMSGLGGHLPPTLLQDVQVVAIVRQAGSPARADMKAYPAYYNDRVVYFMDTDHADGLIPDANGTLVQRQPVPTIGLSIMGPNIVSDFFAIDGQDPVVDSVPGLAGHSPLWRIQFVRRKAGFTPVLTSKQAVLDAQAAGNVTIQAGNANQVFDCPLVPASQVH